MKFSRLGFVAAFVLALAGQAVAATAPAPPKLDPKLQAQGMAEAPAIVKTAGLDCTVSDAYLLGHQDIKVDGKAAKSSIYEIACGTGLGYMIVAKPGQPTDAYDCLTLRTGADQAIAAKQKPANTCDTLAANADPKNGLLPYLTKAGVSCPSVDKAVYVGSSPTDKLTVFEAACAGGIGYYMEVPGPGSVKPLNVLDCAQIECHVVTKDEVMAHIIKLSGPANRAGCNADRGRYVGSTSTSDFYEIGCTGGKPGYMMETTKVGLYKSVIECPKALQIGGGCTYTDVSAGQTAEVSTYQQLAKQISFNCKVSKYQSFGTEPDGPREIVELACADHPDSSFAIVPTATGQTGEYFNCVRASIRGLTCHLTPMEATYAAISTEIAARGKTTCAVNGGRPIGRDAAKGVDYIEVSCGNGPGLVLEYSKLPQETLVSALPCAQAAIADACKLQKK